MSQYPNAPYSGGPTDPSAYGYQQDPRSQKKGLAITALVLGILSLPAILTVFGGILLGLVAIILGIVAIRGAGKGKNGGKGLAIAGLVTGAIGLLVSAAILAFVGTVLFGEDGQRLQDCISQANGDSAAEQQCQREFQDNFGN